MGRPHPAATLSGLHVTVEELSETQDAALTQVIALATLAKAPLDGEADDAADNAATALAAIVKLAAVAAEELDLAMLDIRGAAERESVVGGASPFGHVAPLWVR